MEREEIIKQLYQFGSMIQSIQYSVEELEDIDEFSVDDTYIIIQAALSLEKSLIWLRNIIEEFKDTPKEFSKIELKQNNVSYKTIVKFLTSSINKVIESETMSNLLVNVPDVNITLKISIENLYINLKESIGFLNKI